MKHVILDVETTGLNPLNDELVCIGAYVYEDGKTICLGRENGSSEESILKWFWDMVPENATFVGFNLKFDLRFLVLRSLKNGIKGNLKLPCWERMLDLQRLINMNEKVKGTLTEMVSLVNEDYATDGKDGGKVPELFRRGKHEEIMKMNKRDLKATTELYEALVHNGFL